MIALRCRINNSASISLCICLNDVIAIKKYLCDYIRKGTYIRPNFKGHLFGEMNGISSFTKSYEEVLFLRPVGLLRLLLAHQADSQSDGRCSEYHHQFQHILTLSLLFCCKYRKKIRKLARGNPYLLGVISLMIILPWVWWYQYSLALYLLQTEQQGR